MEMITSMRVIPCLRSFFIFMAPPWLFCLVRLESWGISTVPHFYDSLQGRPCPFGARRRLVAVGPPVWMMDASNLCRSACFHLRLVN
jgi:hypothetical protein